MPSKEAMEILRTCREMLARSNSSEHASPVMFRACLCTHGWLAACSPIPATNQRMVHRGDDGDEDGSPLTGGPLVPLSAVLVMLCVGVVVLVYAYRQQVKRRRGSAVDSRRDR